MMPLRRRDFLKRSAVLMTAGLGVPAFLAETALALSHPAPISATSSMLDPVQAQAQVSRGRRALPALDRRVLVVLQLAGGNDGLNTLVPYGDPLYYQARPTLSIPQDQVLALDDQLGLSPQLGNLKARYDQGQVAIVQGVGYPNPNRSHFEAMDIWQTAAPERSEPSGWLGRYLQACGCGMDSHLEAIQLGSTVQRSFWTELTLVPAISRLAAFQYGSPRANPAARSYEVEALRRALSETRGRPEEEYLRQATLTALDDADTLARVAQSYQSSVTYPQTYLGESLRTIAQVIAGDVGTRVFFATLGGFDTHANQAATQQRLLTDLDGSLEAFFQDLEQMQRQDDVVVMTFSEFGRRVFENGSNGTDHGTAEPLFVVGGAVNGGVHGPTPSLQQLDRGDLRFTTDFRSVYGSLLSGWLATPPDQILGGVFPSLPLVG
jgi:uncharacterized protein (DUF1501 family)